MLATMCCCGPPCTGDITVHVNGCGGLALKGASVTIKLGGITVDSGTTDASGNYTSATLAAGTYSVTASYTGLSSSTLSATISCPSSQHPSLTFSLVASTYVCCAHYSAPIPTTLHATINGVLRTFNYSAGIGWVGSVPSGTVSDCLGSTSVSGIPTLVCPTSDGGPFTLTDSMIGTCADPGAVGQCTYRRSVFYPNDCNIGYSVTSSPTSDSPFAISFTVPSTWSTTGCSACGPMTFLYSGTVTFSP